MLLAGFLIAGAAFVATRSSGSVVCGQLNIGSATDVRRPLDSGGPYFQTGGAGCGFWLALADGNIVAYKVEQPQDCTLKLTATTGSAGRRRSPPTTSRSTRSASRRSARPTRSSIDLLPPGADVDDHRAAPTTSPSG